MDYIFLATLNQFNLPKIEMVLRKNNIDFFIKDPYLSSLAGGWITPGSLYNEKTIYVDKEKINQAKILLNKLIEIER